MSTPGFLDSISPWTSRSATPKPVVKDDGTLGDLGPQQRAGGDHRINHRHRVSLRDYPEDCPMLKVRWFYAVDVGGLRCFSIQHTETY